MINANHDAPPGHRLADPLAAALSISAAPNKSGHSVYAETGHVHSRLGSIRELAAHTVDCVLAHWYLLPGLKFQRFRVSLGMQSVFHPEELIRSILSHVLHGAPPAISYLDFDFAWKSLPIGKPLGGYLDVSSPWLFPLALLSRGNISNATLISHEADALKHLLDSRTSTVKPSIRCAALESAAADNECYDTVTSLSWLGHVQDDISLVQTLWRSLKPGGSLLLSVPCAKDGREEYAASLEHTENEPRRSVFRRRLYDSPRLSSRIFEVLGQPRGYALYGESSRPGQEVDAGSESSRQSCSCRNLGRNWRSYSRLQELPGEGMIAMKFVKSSTGGVSSPRFSCRLA